MKPSARASFHRWVPMLVLPTLETAAFVAGALLFERAPALALGLLAVSALALSLTVHVFLHELVHFDALRPIARPWRLLATWIGGLPFDGYRLHHWNHHAHDNGPADFSTTWNFAADGRRPRGLASYAFGWPLQLARAARALRRERTVARDARNLGLQQLGLAGFVVGLGCIHWSLGAAYVAVVYFGWVLISVHNYGQHPPVEGVELGTTFSSPTYNRLLFNNGLHWEHHRSPGAAWFELHVDTHSHRVSRAHPFGPRSGAIEETHSSSATASTR